MPINADQEGRLVDASASPISSREKAQLWINHDKAQHDTLEMVSDFHD